MVINKENMKDKKAEIFIHTTAVIEKNVVIGGGCKVWNWSRILEGSVIGKKCSVGQNVVIGPNVTIGTGCKIQNNVSIYEGVSFGKNVFCGPSVVFTNVLNPRSEFVRKNEIRNTVIKKGATLGANSTILCGTIIGEYAFVGAGTVVTSDVPSFALVIGNPSRHVGWMSRYGIRLDLPLLGCGACVCSFTGDSYRLVNNEIKLLKLGSKKE